jgi:hypothetical protein
LWRTGENLIIPELSRADLAQLAGEKYPQLFADHKNALPLVVQINCRSDYSVSAMAIIGALTLSVLPMCQTVTSDLSIRTMLADEIQGLVLDKTVTFQRKDIGWFSIWPWGMLPRPGASDFPRTSGWMKQNFFPEDLIFAGWPFTRKACVDAIVQAVQQGDPERLQSASRYAEHYPRLETFTVAGQTLWCRRVAQATQMPVDPVPDVLLGEIYLEAPASGRQPAEVVRLATRVGPESWQATPHYLHQTKQLAVATAVLENGKPVRASVTGVSAPLLEDFLEITAGYDVAEVQWRTRCLLQAKNHTLPALLQTGGATQLADLTTRTEQALVAATHLVTMSKDRAQHLLEKGEGDPSSPRALASAQLGHMAVLKAILVALKEAAAYRGR